MIYRLNNVFSEGMMCDIDEEYKNQRLAELGVTITYYGERTRTVFWDSSAVTAPDFCGSLETLGVISSEEELQAELERCEFSRGARRITPEEQVKRRKRIPRK